MTPEQIAEAILNAAGSSLRHYTTRTRDDILSAAQVIKGRLKDGAVHAEGSDDFLSVDLRMGKRR